MTHHTPHHIPSTTQEQRPLIAIIEPNTLAALGLAGLIDKMMPMVETRIFESFDELESEGDVAFMHYFISSLILLEHADYFLERRRKTIVLVEGPSRCLPAPFPTIDMSLSQEELVRAFVHLGQSAHGPQGKHPEIAQRGQRPLADRPALTPREVEVLKLVVSGLTNKEIAATLNVGLTTVISHRKNLTEKLGFRSVSALTVYAVSHGYIKMEEI
ncbi:MAG: helix-turn-helix transcriptional regulator [Bacteroidales bacterium]|nr:helix-turn-helix transcriptional regulator [Bacteroidales bacterium]